MSKPPSPKVVVQTFYDQVGWQEDNTSHLFMDAHLFEDLRSTTAPYRARANQRVKELMNAGGDLLLDAASGPIQYDSYLQFADRYRKRVCVDLSLRALTGARKRIGDRGWFVQADVTALPFAANTFDAIVSLHTIYHVPADEQGLAIRELYRTLKTGRCAVVVYNWPRNTLKRVITIPFCFLDAVKGMIVKIPGAWLVIRRIKAILHRAKVENTAPRENLAALPPLYFHSHPLRWFRREFDSLFRIEVRCWRSVDVPFLRAVPASKRGERLLKFIRNAEDRFPHLMGRIGAYPLVVIRKTGAD